MEPLAIDADLPPSARHVAHALQEEGPLTQRELIVLTSLPASTVDDALVRLSDQGLLTSRRRLDDNRKQQYELNE